MSFDLIGWNTTSSGGRRGLNGAMRDYAYRTSDTLSDVRGVSYFDSVNDRLSIGDQINVHSETDNVSEVYVISQVSPTVVLGKKYPGTNFIDHFNIMMVDLSDRPRQYKYTTTVGRKINRIIVVTEDGIPATNDTEIVVTNSDFSDLDIVTDSQILLTPGSLVGTIFNVAATDRNTIAAGTVTTLTALVAGIQTTSVAVRANVILETELLIDS